MQLIRFLISVSWKGIAFAVIAGLIGGAANAYLVTQINSIISPQPHPDSTITRFAVTAAVVLVTGLLSQILLIHLAQNAIYRLRAKLSTGVVSAPLEHLERLGMHRLMATLTEDVRALSQAVSAIPSICIDAATIVGCLAYLAMVSGPIFAITVGSTLAAILCVETVLRRVRSIYHHAREREDDLLRSFQSVTFGIKELKLHRGRRRDFMDRHLLGTAEDLRGKNVSAGTKFSMAQGFGQLCQLGTMAFILFGLAVLLKIPRDDMIGYVLITTFLSMPMQNMMHLIPDILRGDVALAKIQDMNLSMESGQDESNLPYIERPTASHARVELRGLGYAYRGEQMSGPPAPPSAGPPKSGGRPAGPPPGGPGEGSGFHLGPIDLVLDPGQVTFVVGGNGSGKSTLAKLITGLYAPHHGQVVLNGEPIDYSNVEWYRQNVSAVFTDFHLFEDYLGFDGPGIDDQVRGYLHQLQIAHKVTVQDGKLSTTALSQGQRKRLTLVTALLEDRPIYVFDEWAADQEPQFREYFYRRILSDLKEAGKTVVVITHDDRYFDLADQLVKLDFGQLESAESAGREPVGALQATV
ncbi:UNVERIFIED_CONTAM: putative ATP-binding cassette transporter [Williamsia faeni]